MLFSVVIYAVLAAAMLYHFATQPTYPGFREWMLCAVGQAAGLLLVASYPVGRPTPGFLVIVANLVLVGSLDQMARGLRHYGGEAAALTLDEALVYGAALAALCYWVFVDYSVPARVAVNGAAMSFAAARGATTAWRLRGGSARGPALYLAAVLGAAAVVNLARGLASLAASGVDPLSPVRQRSGLETVLLLLLPCLGTAAMLGFLMLGARRAQTELQEALTRVKRLEGIIPICMHCFRVRTDKDTWDRLEKYVGEHTEAELSHGVCPDCLERHYPESAPPGGQGGSSAA